MLDGFTLCMYVCVHVLCVCVCVCVCVRVRVCVWLPSPYFLSPEVVNAEAKVSEHAMFI